MIEQAAFHMPSMENRHLLIGGYGKIGTAVHDELDRRGLSFDYTAKASRLDMGAFTFDLDQDSPEKLPPAEVVYLVAARIVPVMSCEWDPATWRVNADGPIGLARWYQRAGAFIVFVSSDAVEKASGTAYARQKAHVESFIRAIDGAIVRPGPVSIERAPELAKVIVDVGCERRVGLTRWQ